METAIIFTDDSDVKLPRINRWKNTLGRGRHIQNHEALLETLHKLGLPIPGKNLGLEQVYCNALREYTRPAQLMLAGMFAEVRDFYNRLRKNGKFRFVSYHLGGESEIDLPREDVEDGLRALMVDTP